MGSHTDYNLGYVLTLPIDRDTWIAARPREDRLVRLYSINSPGETCSFELDSVSRLPGAAWSNYVRGVAAVLQTEGMALKGFDAVIHSTVPISSGLSSSAALECATATVFESVSGFAARARQESPAVPAGREPVRGGQLRHPRPIYLLLRSGRVRLALGLPRPLQPSSAVSGEHPSGHLRYQVQARTGWLRIRPAPRAMRGGRSPAGPQCLARDFTRAILRAGEGIAA